MRIPCLIQTSTVLERTLPHNLAIALNYTNTRGVHILRTRDINAPLPTAYDNQGRADGPRPYGALAGDIYQYEGSGVFRQNQVIVSAHARFNRRITLFGSYVYSRAMSDTDLEGPGILSLTVRVSRTWSLGGSGKGGGNTGSDEVRGGQSIRNGGLSGSSNQSGMASVFGDTATRRPYNLTFTAAIRNAMNNVNPATPIGNLSSSYFGRSIALSTFGPLPGAGPNAGAGNRHIELQVRFTF